MTGPNETIRWDHVYLLLPISYYLLPLVKYLLPLFVNLTSRPFPTSQHALRNIQHGIQLTLVRFLKYHSLQVGVNRQSLYGAHIDGDIFLAYKKT